MQVSNVQSIFLHSAKGITTALLIALVTGNTWASDVDHTRAINIARNRVPTGVAVETQDEIYDGIEDTYECELIIDNGNTIADVEIDRTTGAVVQYTELPQNNAQRAYWQQILGLEGSNQLDFKNAQRKALALYPDAGIFQIQMDLEFGVLQYDVDMVDAFGAFKIEIDAVTGAVGGADRRGKTFKNAASIARGAASGATLLFVKLATRNADQRYETMLTARRGKREIDVIMDDITGTIIRNKVRRTPRRRIRGNNKKINLAGNARIDYARALILTRKEIGGGRPISITLDVRNGRLYFKSVFKQAALKSTVWIDAITAGVWKRR